MSIYASRDLGGKMLCRQVLLSWREALHQDQDVSLRSGHELSHSVLEAELRLHIWALGLTR